MNRRSFLAAAGAAALLPSRAKASDLRFCKSFATEEVLTGVYSSNSRTLAGHPFHRDPIPLAYIFSPDHIEKLAQAGKKHVFIEVDQSLQNVFDMAARGNVSAISTLFIPWLSPGISNRLTATMGVGTRRMAMQGIQVYCYDTMMQEVDSETRQRFIDHCTGKAPMDQATNEKMTNARLDDRRRADFIDSVAKDDPVFIHAGGVHLEDHATSLKTLFNPFAMNYYGNNEMYCRSQNECPLEQDFTFLNLEGVIYKTGNQPFPQSVARGANGDRLTL